MTQLAIKLRPGASADRIDGWDADPWGRAVLKVRVRARPIEGQANEALVNFLAHALDLPKSAVTLARGPQSRLKMVDIAGLDDTALRARIDLAAP
jgi:uncharacterized protein YggU (UPF0235/DUF167 family)